jgi:hypothetical protein
MGDNWGGYHMKKMLFVLVLIFLVGCGNKDYSQDIDDHVEKMKTHAESAAADREGYIEDLKAFNEFLDTIDDEKYEEYVKKQKEANKMRLEALETDNSDLITESSLLQATALQIYDKLKESE